jgi:predicted MFS family arabinose efflux permease
MPAAPQQGARLSDAPPLPAARRARQHYVLAVLLVVYTVNFIDRNLLFILLEPIKQELGASDTQMGWLIGFAFALFYTLAGIPIARLADHGSRRGVMSIGIAFWSLMTAASGLVGSYAQLAVARIAVGVGEASATPAAHAMIADLYPPTRRARALSIYTTGANFGVLFGLLLGGFIQQRLGWRAAFVLIGMPGLLIALLVRLTLPEPRRGESEGLVDPGAAPAIMTSLRHLAGVPTFCHLAVSAGLYGICCYGLVAWVPAFLIRIHGLSPGETGWKSGLAIGIAGAIGTVSVGILTDRLVQRDRRWLLWIPAAAAALQIPFHVLFALSPDADVAILALVPVSFLNGIFGPLGYTLAQGLAPVRMRAMASATLLFVLNLVGMGLGPMIVGWLNDTLAATRGAASIRISILVLLAANVWGIAHSLRATRTVEADLAHASHLGSGS